MWKFVLQCWMFVTVVRAAPVGLPLPSSMSRLGWKILKENNEKHHQKHGSLDEFLPDLIEVKDKHLDPTAKDLDRGTLMNILAENFDLRYMSVNRPLESKLLPNGTLEYDFKRNRPVGKMPDSIRNLDFTSQLSLPDGPSIKSKLTSKLSKKVQRFLWAYSYCPVNFTWKDLGVRFWPRWIKIGRCYNGRSCSIPAGMGCKPSGTRHLTLLRWHCKNWDYTRSCSWIRVQYPIISECQCSC